MHVWRSVHERLEKLVPSWQERASVQVAGAEAVSQTACTVSYVRPTGSAWMRLGLVSAG